MLESLVRAACSLWLVPRDVLREGDARKAAEASAAEAFSDVEASAEVLEPCVSHLCLGSCGWCQEEDEPIYEDVALAQLRFMSQAPAVSATAAVKADPEEACPPAASSGVPILDWCTYVHPAICDVLAEHEPELVHTTGRAVFCASADGLEGSFCGEFDDWQDWRHHVAELIAQRLEAITLVLPEM